MEFLAGQHLVALQQLLEEVSSAVHQPFRLLLLEAVSFGNQTFQCMVNKGEIVIHFLPPQKTVLPLAEGLHPLQQLLQRPVMPVADIRHGDNPGNNGEQADTEPDISKGG
ncbi:hypothetical protein D3C75_1099710 [compost metagenome]